MRNVSGASSLDLPHLSHLRFLSDLASDGRLRWLVGTIRSPGENDQGSRGGRATTAGPECRPPGSSADRDSNNDNDPVYAVVILSIIGLLIGWPPDQQNETQMWTAWLMPKPYGRFIVGAVGLLILACGAGVVVWVLTADIDDDVALPEGEKRFLEPLGRYGLGGRGVAAALVGLYWIVAALHRDPSKALELGGTLQAVHHHDHGWMLLLPLGAAFAASALFDFVEALYHEPARLMGGR